MNLSIIIVNWNTKELLKNCINSILEHTNGIQYEIIIVDNDSDDGSIEMINTFERFKDVILISNDSNAGFAKANNQGIKVANGKYILLLNSDTLLLNNVLKESVERLEEEKEVGILGCKLLNADSTLQFSTFNFVTIKRIFVKKLLNYIGKAEWVGDSNMLALVTFDHESERLVDYVKGAYMMIRKKVIEDIGVLDEQFFMYSEEADFSYRARKHNWVTKYYPIGPIIHYGGQSASRKKGDTNRRERAESRLKFIKKHYSFVSIVIYKIMSYK